MSKQFLLPANTKIGSPITPLMEYKSIILKYLQDFKVFVESGRSRNRAKMIDRCGALDGKYFAHPRLNAIATPWRNAS